jgi:hypothetical protein
MSFFKWLDEDFKKFEKFDQKKLQDWMADLKKQELKPRSIVSARQSLPRESLLISEERNS